MGRTYGYARVSSTEQNLDRQIEALLEYGVEERDIVTDKQAGITARSRTNGSIFSAWAWTL